MKSSAVTFPVTRPPTRSAARSEDHVAHDAIRDAVGAHDTAHAPSTRRTRARRSRRSLSRLAIVVGVARGGREGCATAAARGAREGKAQAHVSGISRLEPARARGTFSRTRRRRSRDRPAGRGARRTDPARRPVPRRTRPRDGDGRRRLFPRAATPTRASIPVVHGSNVLRSPEHAGGGATCRHGTASDADHSTREGRATEKNEQKNERRLGHSWRRRRAIRRAPLPGGRRPHRPDRSRSIVCWKNLWKTSGNSGRPRRRGGDQRRDRGAKSV